MRAETSFQTTNLALQFILVYTKIFHMNAIGLLAEPNRVEILRLVWTQELSAGDIARQFRITFGAISQHLGALFRAGLVRRRRDGKRIYYAADRAALGPLALALEAMWSQKLAALQSLAEAEQRRIDTAGTAARAAETRTTKGRKRRER